MIDLSSLQGTRFAVLGLARSGLAAARALQAAQVDVVVWDDDATRRAQAQSHGFALADPESLDWHRWDALVLSPGIPHTFPRPHPAALAARTAGKPVIGDIELLARSRPLARVVGITGTNGKSTTTALIGHILKSAGIQRDIGGNFGPAALDFRPLGRDGVYVLELSSFQLELVQSLRCSVAVWLNITPDHIDRHGDLAGYVAAKRHVFDNQQEGDVAVVGIDDGPSRQTAAGLAGGPGTLLTVTVGGADGAGVSVQGGRLRDACTGAEIDLRPIKNLPGAHNWQNAACAYAACHALGLPIAAIAQGLATYPGLAHRQERVAVVDGIVYINDSKATNADATEKALAAYDTIYWLVGGTPKAEGIVPLEPLFGRVAHAFLIGISSDAFAVTLEGKIPYTRSGDLKTALQQAHEMAQRERRRDAVVLLSPACASYDQWPNFEVRGDAFRTLARALPGATVETGGAA
ncbi:UDP-N-acetylmuramoyl-L-alanine--D-glutamate ligase [Vineibacter terrae]|uniref:UDP-N-acetylmuramoylalanine--D-glutamate ligase n=1 Tax=Vineibacter terrae TaxID=2586908 RepID=A0A5C8PJM7_9HYPH|nr:UDP-N-acetylmuramoyl-L-alanine--D-glutamate ligase [Vineibacter terrae]TXL73559.1 UDP-N-acetylmuramoyl-L-alanine--D-glutamate ligase [Vineibacter terrae]